MILSRTLARILPSMMRMVFRSKIFVTLGAWPVIIDDFVAYGKIKVESGYGDKMMED
jgi:hypothetical protein